MVSCDAFFIFSISFACFALAISDSFFKVSIAIFYSFFMASNSCLRSSFDFFFNFKISPKLLHLCINTRNMSVALLRNKSSIILLEAITTQGSKAKYLFTGHYYVQIEQLSTSRFKLSLLLSCAGQLGTS